MSMAKYSTIKVIDLIPFGQDSENRFFALRLSRPDWDNFKAGQFAMIRPQGFGLDLLWARPFSICRLTDNELVFFFQVVGRGTELMSKLKKNDLVNIWGPLGNGFEIDPENKMLILAGGIGIVPFLSLVDRHPKPWNIKMLFGHRIEISSYPVEHFNLRIQVDSYFETNYEDRALFLTKVKEEMQKTKNENGQVLACGPTPFLKFVQGVADEIEVRTQISLENLMACGLGACLGCVVMPTEKNPISQGSQGLPQRVCVNGPVFWSDLVVLE